MAIGQKIPKLTKREEQGSYDAATARDLDQCQRCGRYGDTERDHRQNRDAWNTRPSNLQLLGGPFGCGCHKWKTENPADALRDGFAVPRWGNPAEWPAYRIWNGWVLYLDKPDRFGLWWQPLTEEEALARLAALMK